MSLTAGESTVADVEIVLIRHGQPEWVRDGLNVVDPPLTDLGHEQADRMASVWRQGDASTRCSCRRSSRARQTAAPLYERLGVEEQIDPWLEEIRDPGWHGTPVEKAEQAYREMRDRPVDERWHGLDGGESIRDFTDRVHLGARLFLAERGIERIDHDLPIWSMRRTRAPDRARRPRRHQLGDDRATCSGSAPTPWEWDRFVLGHTSVSRLEAIPVHGGCTFSLTSLSNLEHLPVDLRTR